MRHVARGTINTIERSRDCGTLAHEPFDSSFNVLDVFAHIAIRLSIHCLYLVENWGNNPLETID
jgi:hypothetical protein